MQTPPRLSSSLITFLSEWVVPAIWLWAGRQQIQIALALRATFGEVIWIMVIVWGIGLLVVLIYSWPIKKVTVEGDHFVISNYFITRRVYISHLVKVGESGFGYIRTIILYFEPPTPFGKRVRLIIPFWGSDFDEIVAFLRSLISNRERPQIEGLRTNH